MLMAAAGANAVVLRPPPAQDVVLLERNRKTVNGWFTGKNRVPWLYKLRRKPNFGACKACLHYHANINDQLTRGEFELVNDKRRPPRRDYLTEHAKHASHQTNCGIRLFGNSERMAFCQATPQTRLSAGGRLVRR